MELSPDQQEALDRVVKWFEAAPQTQYCNSGDEDSDDYTPESRCPRWPHTHGQAEEYPVMSVGGLAGTGKTTVLGQLSERLGAKVAYGAPTHKAAHVLRGKLRAEDRDNVRTYFSLVYHAQPYATCDVTGQYMPEIDPENGCVCGKPDSCECARSFRPCFEVEGAQLRGEHECRPVEQLKFDRRSHLGGYRDLVVVDEASMIPTERVRDICAMGVPVLLIGDHGQLPPVKEELNPWMLRPTVELTTNFRQSEESGIVAAALEVRRTGQLSRRSYGDGSTVVTNLSTPGIADLFTPDRFPPGPTRTIICWTNAMRAEVNERFHGEGPVRVGERVISLGQAECTAVTPKSETEPASTDSTDGWLYGDVEQVFNGMVGTVRAVIPVMLYSAPRKAGAAPAVDGKRHGTASKSVVDLVIEIDAGPTVLVRHVALAQFGNPQKLAPNQRPRGSSLWDYAYAITAHKAQGSEYDDVIVIDQGRMTERARWMYTALTRAKKRLVVVEWRA